MKHSHQKELLDELSDFFTQYGSKLKHCHVIAYIQLKALIEINGNDTIEELFIEFLWGSLDYLMNCNYDAFILIYEITRKYGFEEW